MRQRHGSIALLPHDAVRDPPAPRRPRRPRGAMRNAGDPATLHGGAASWMPGPPGMGLCDELRRKRAGRAPHLRQVDAQSSINTGTSYQRACGKRACIH